MRRQRFVLVAVALTFVGCAGGKPAKQAVYPVRGKVLLNGQPAEAALVVFHPAAGSSYRPMGRCGADGTFKLSTFAADDGAPEGEYAVTVYAPVTPPKDADDAPPDKLKGRYTDPAKSQLKFKVAPGPNEFEIKVQ